ncbi:PrgI family protein [Brevibacillus massiliensis]|uniref:PrgI family protein n=1 Tax=Brevibacillus massiliensis TaxID=1118054 RepID=UPI000308B43D|nr:PrgI family protein [Brevibacillus massiliensis]
MYLIPKNVKARFEFRDGFGWKELGMMLVGAVVGVVLFLLSGLLIDSLVSRVLILLVPIAGAFLLIQPHPATKLSVLITLRMIYRFRQSKKLYLYRFGGSRN